MDFKIRENNQEDTKPVVREGYMDVSIKSVDIINEAERRFREAADDKSAASESEENYAVNEFYDNASQIGNTAIKNTAKVTFTSNNLNQLRETRKQRKKDKTKNENEIGSAGTKKKARKKANSDDKKNNVKLKADVSDSVKIRFKDDSGKSLKTSEGMLDMPAIIIPGMAEAEMLEAEKLAGLQESDSAGVTPGAIITKIMKVVVTVVTNIVILPLLPIFLLILFIMAIVGNGEVLEEVGNMAADMFDTGHSYYNNFVGHIGVSEEEEPTVTDDSIIFTAVNEYHEALREVIDEQEGCYDYIDYSEAEPDWLLLLKMFVSVEFIENDGYNENISEEAFIDFMWSAVSIEYELLPAEEKDADADADTEDVSEPATEETTETSAEESSEDEKIILTIYAVVKSEEEIAETYGIDEDKLSQVISMSGMYTKYFSTAINKIPEFEIEPETEKSQDNYDLER